MIYNEGRYNSHWDTKKLSDLGTFARGVSKYRPRNDEKLFEGGGYPLIQTGEIKSANLYVTQHTQEYGEFGLKQSKLWEKDTLCITIAANIAETAILSYPMCFPDSVVGFRADKEKSSELFMHYVFDYIRHAIQNAATGSAQDNINIDYLTSLDFKVPTKEYQDKIVAVLATIDRKILFNEQVNDNLQQQLHLLYDYWFTQFDFPDENGKPYRSSGGQMMWNDQLKKHIPKRWHCALLREVLKQAGTGINNIKGKEHLCYTPVDTIPQRTISFAGGLDALEANSSLQLYEKDDILLGAMRVYFHRVCIAAQNGITRTTTMILKPVDGKNYLGYAYSVLNDDRAILYANQNSSGTQQPYINWNDALERYPFAAPDDKKLMLKYSQLVRPLINEAQSLSIENCQLQKLRDWLLPMLMNGQATIDD